MILSEFGSTGIEEISVFQALSPGNGMKPFRSAPGPVSMPAHVPFCAKLSLDSESNERPMKIITSRVFITLPPCSLYRARSYEATGEGGIRTLGSAEIPILRAISLRPMPDAKTVFSCPQVSTVIVRRIVLDDHIITGSLYNPIYGL